MIDLSKHYEITPQWLGGFFDGEGLVGLYTDKELEVKLAQQDPTVLVLIAAKFSDWSWGYSQNASELRFYNLNAKPFLEYIQKYVIVKKTQVDCALAFLAGKISREDCITFLKNEKRNHPQCSKYNKDKNANKISI
jgi:hypothetical protein